MSDPEGEDKKPWADRKRVQPLRTYSGSIKYAKRQKGWTARDFERIAVKMGEMSIDDTSMAIRFWNIYINLVRKWLWAVFTFWGYIIGWNQLRGLIFPMAEMILEMERDIIEEEFFGWFDSVQRMREAKIFYIRRVQEIMGVRVI